MYLITVLYDADDFPALDQPIQSLALKYRGQEIGAGMGFGQRDLVFRFSELDPLTLQFIEECLNLPDCSIRIAAIPSPCPSN